MTTFDARNDLHIPKTANCIAGQAVDILLIYNIWNRWKCGDDPLALSYKYYYTINLKSRVHYTKIKGVSNAEQKC